MLNRWVPRLRPLVVMGALTLGACAATPPSPDVATPAEAPALDASVAAALRRASQTIAAAPAFTVRVRMLHERVLGDGQRVLLSGTSVITARRPDRVTAHVGSDLGNYALWYDGAAVTVWNPQRDVYSAVPLSGDLLAVADWVEDRLGLALPVRPMLAADPYAAMLEAGPTTGRLLGRSFVGSTLAEHYVLRNPHFTWEIWLEATPRALPLRVSITYPTAQGPLRRTIELEAWDLAPRVPDQAFVFVPGPRSVPATMLLRPESATGGTTR
jgi:hypothetical protein